MAKMQVDYAARRRAALRQAVRQVKAQSFLVTKVEDVGYLSGFTGDDSALLVGPKYACLITDGRYDEQARRECPDIEIHVRTKAIAEVAAALLKDRKLRGRLAVQAEEMTLRGRTWLEKYVKPARIQPTTDIIITLRQRKDPAEVAVLRKAVRAAEEALASMLKQGKRAFLGRTEREIAADLDYRMRLAGADKSGFDTIVAAGANGSLPHYRPGNVVVKEGMAVLVDWGAVVGGYTSDLTRVVFIGKIPPELATVYDVVLRAQSAGISAIRGGVSGKTVDAAARKVIESAGFGDRFVHGLGHGIGRQIHELPVLGKHSKAPLRAGMVVTVEPGIYLPGVGGVRIEDDVLVTEGGRIRLTSLPREIEAMLLK